MTYMLAVSGKSRMRQNARTCPCYGKTPFLIEHSEV